MTIAPPARRGRGRPATVSARILDTTERLLADGAQYGDLAVEVLLNESGVSRSSFYANFTDKSALLHALAEKTIGELVASGATWWESTHDLGPDAAAETVRDLIRIYRQHAPLIRAIAEAAPSDKEIADLWRSRREAFASRIADGIRREQEEGFVDPDLDIARTASYVTLLVDAAVLDHVRHGSPRQDRQVAAALARMGWLAYYGRLDTKAPATRG